MAPAGKVCQSCLNKINLNSIISSFLSCKVDALIRNASNCEAANIQAWLSNPNRNPLPSLSAIAYPRVQLEVVSNSSNLFEGRCSISYQRCSVDSFFDFTILNSICFCTRKNKLSICNIYLPSTKAHSVKTVF